jgi:anti-sigma B factor antagonist
VFRVVRAPLYFGRRAFTFPPLRCAMASTPPRRRRLEVEDIGDIAVVNFVDKKILDEQNIQMIGDDLFRLVDELGRRKVLLNFGNVEFMSSAALGKLITLHRKLQAVQGKLVLCKIAKDILDVFKITKLDKILTITTDEQSGLQSFS